MNRASSGLTDFIVTSVDNIPPNKATELHDAINNEGVYSALGLIEAVQEGILTKDDLTKTGGKVAAHKIITRAQNSPKASSFASSTATHQSTH